MLRVSTPDSARIASWMAASSPDAIRQFVWGMTRTRSTPSSHVARTSVRSTSSVTRAPAFRRILTSPVCMPVICSGEMRESMQVTIASPRRAVPDIPSSWNDAA